MSTKHTVGGSGTASASMHSDLMASRSSRYGAARAARLQREEDHRNGIEHPDFCFSCEHDRTVRTNR